MSHFICPNCDDKHYIFGEGGGLKISEQFKIPFLGEIPLNSGIMAGSDLGKPIMISSVDSPSAEAFRISAKNIAAQCSIQAAKLQEEMAAEPAEETAETPESTTQN
jgi:ATP-binding protein involved in chromosome partitioning